MSKPAVCAQYNLLSGAPVETCIDYAFVQEAANAVREAYQEPLHRFGEGIEFTITGGFLRDMVLGRQIADIDVAVACVDDFTGTVTQYSNGDDEYDHGFVVATSIIDEVRGHPVQLIERTGYSSTPADLFQYHLCGLSDIAVYYTPTNPGGTLMVGQYFWECVYRRKLILKGHAADATRYIEKIKKKYAWEVEDRR